jgi:fructan beta-fructosidase
MTVPRELALKQINGSIFLTSAPVTELAKITLKPLDVAPKGNVTAPEFNNLPAQYILKFKIDHIADYSILLSNDEDEKLIVGYDKSKNRYYIDRTKSGKIDFNKEFAGSFFAPRISSAQSSDVELIVDASSVELFADKGLSVMSSVFFPNKPYDHLQFQNDKRATIKDVEILPLKSIW